jgi:hypothetical protein
MVVLPRPQPRSCFHTVMAQAAGSWGPVSPGHFPPLHMGPLCAKGLVRPKYGVCILLQTAQPGAQDPGLHVSTCVHSHRQQSTCAEMNKHICTLSRAQHTTGTGSKKRPVILFFFFLAALEFELRASHFLGR